MPKFSKLDQARLQLFSLIPHCAPEFRTAPWQQSVESKPNPSATPWIMSTQYQNSCYAYALNDPEIYRDPTPGTRQPAWPVPGINEGRRFNMDGVTNVDLLEFAITDTLIYAGMEMPPLLPGTYVVAAFTCFDKLIDPAESTRGMHFCRMDRNGTWSEKNGTAPPNNTLDGKELIFNLQYYAADHRAYDQMRLVGYFYVPNSGVAIGRRSKVFCNPTSIEANRKTPKTSADCITAYIQASKDRNRAA